MSKKLTQEEFIAKAKLIHPQYDYSKVKYIHGGIKVKIICLIHGEYEVIPASLLQGRGCRRCYDCLRGSTLISTKEEFIAKAKLIHPQYDYSKVEYINARINVTILCPIHGEYEVTPDSLLSGCRCRKCANEAKSSNTEEFIAKAKLIRPEYDYSKVKYINARTKVKIICSKHGEFEAKSYGLLNGVGCPSCNESNGEKKICTWLSDNNIEYIREKKFPSCRNKKPLPFDFYVESKKILIEFDGEQHFNPIEYFGGEKAYQLNVYRDSIKTKWALANGYSLIRLDYKMTDNEISETLAFLL